MRERLLWDRMNGVKSEEDKGEVGCEPSLKVW